MIESLGALSQDSGPTPRLLHPNDLRFGAVLAAAAVLVGIGSFGTWSVLQPRRVATYIYTYVPPVHRGIQSWQGPGWVTLALAFFSAIFVLLAVAKSMSEARVVAVALLAAVVVVAAYNVIAVLYWFGSGSVGISFSVGWGLWLCFSSAILGASIGSLWIRQVRRSAPNPS